MRDATSEHDLLLPVRVRPCELQGLLAQLSMSISSAAMRVPPSTGCSSVSKAFASSLKSRCQALPEGVIIVGVEL